MDTGTLLVIAGDLLPLVALGGGQQGWRVGRMAVRNRLPHCWPG
jgi:hypothetical protein